MPSDSKTNNAAPTDEARKVRPAPSGSQDARPPQSATVEITRSWSGNPTADRELEARAVELAKGVLNRETIRELRALEPTIIAWLKSDPRCAAMYLIDPGRVLLECGATLSRELQSLLRSLPPGRETLARGVATSSVIPLTVVCHGNPPNPPKQPK